MDFENKQDERRDWREQRRKWREDRREERRRYHREAWVGRYNSGRGSISTGIFLLIIGGAALLKAMLFPLPPWIFTWQMLLIALGFFLGIRHNFRGGSWFILMLVGGVFLVNEFFPELMLKQYLWPAALIVLGLFFILKPRRRRWKDYIEDKKDYIEDKIETKLNVMHDESTSGEDFIDSTSIFGGIKKNIISKNFKGGDITNIMGGSEIDFTQADINGTATIDLTQVFGGTKLIVPSNWQVKTQMAAIFGGVEDKRSAQNVALDPNKILVLDGTSIFGGIEIRSY
jgi:predicted membrane protein